MSQGKLMTIEIRGPQGCGKSVTAHDLMTTLVKKGHQVELHDGDVMYRADPASATDATAVLITVKQ